MQNGNEVQGDSAVTPPEFLTAEEVGARLRLPLSTVYHLAKTGVLPAVQLGRSWRFPCRDIDQLPGRSPTTPRVLVVDDDEVTRALVVGVLGPRNCVIAEATSVEEGLAAARRRRFDLLLIDFKMPGRDGTALIRELADEYSLTRMVVITAFPDLAQMDQLFELGALTLLRKPFEPGQLIECVERILEVRLPERSPARTALTDRRDADPAARNQRTDSRSPVKERAALSTKA